MPPKKKGNGKGPLKETQTSEIPRDTPPPHLSSREEPSDDDDDDDDEEGIQDVVLSNP